MEPVFHDISQTLMNRSGAGESDERFLTLVSSLVRELEDSWRDGNGVTVERLLQEHPELESHPESVVRLICEEVSQRRERGDEVSLGEIYHRFPARRDALQHLLEPSSAPIYHGP